MIVSNKIKCKSCGNIIESNNRHDFKFCSCGQCAVDGGHDYLKRSFSGVSPEEYYEDKCKKCKYKRYYGKGFFPCTKCENQPPVTCYDCRYAELGRNCKKGIRPCKNFEWS